MNGTFSHVILTRFNVRLSPSSEAPDEEWLRARVELFKRFPLRSLSSQRVRTFAWLVFIDRSSPSWLLAELSAALEDPRFHVVRSASFRPARAVRQLIPLASPPEFLMTTRLDNDDAVASDFVERIQSAFRPEEAEFINPLNGMQLCDGAVFAKSDPSGPFLTLVERIHADAEPQTVFAVEHEAARRFAPVRQIAGPPLWLQVIHERNLANRPRGIRTRTEALVNLFDVSVEVTEISEVERLVAQIHDVTSVGARVITRPKSAAKAGRIALVRLQPLRSAGNWLRSRIPATAHR